MIHIFTRRQEFPIPISRLFSFFENPENLARITPKSLGFEMLTPAPVVMRQNALIDYSIKVFGLRVRWTTLITEYDPPFKFVDQQIKGPYSFWHHTHKFVERDGVTEMIDEVRYVLPVPFADNLLNKLVIGPQLKSIFNYRSETIARAFSHEENFLLNPRQMEPAP